MKSYVSLLVRNRKVHLVVFLTALIVAIFHTLHSQGISVDYKTFDPHANVPRYQTISEHIKNGFFVTDVRVQRCLRGFSCLLPESAPPSFWVKLPCKLNLYPHGFHLFNYYLYVEKTKGNEAQRFIMDVQFTATDKQPLSQHKKSKWLSHKISSKSYVWINYVENIDFAVDMVRDINVFYGKQDMIDAREHWKFSPQPLLLPLKQTIQPKLSMLMVAVNDEMAIFNKDQLFDNVFKKNEVITTVDPHFKILQISDMHIGQDSVMCIGDRCKFDVRTLKFINEVIEVEGDVSFVMFTGDMIDFTRVKHYELAVLKALAPVLKARIPFAFTFGDSEHEWSDPRTKINILNFIASLPGCYNKPVRDLDRRMHGLTNGNLKVYRLPAAGSKEEYDYSKLALEKPSAVLTYLDSEEMYVDETQSNYLYRILNRLSEVDLKLLFLHNPLPNFRPLGKFKLIGSYNEKHKLQTKLSQMFLGDVKECGYRAVCVGHEHENDLCIWDDSGNKLALLCYSGVAGESAVTRINKNFKRGLRVLDLNFERNEIFSWKRQMLANSKPETKDIQLVWNREDDEKVSKNG